jgi:fructose-bisphosphate aldolase class II
MPLVPLDKIYANANKQFYAIGAFNVSNLEFVQAVIEAAVELKSPAIISASSSAIKYAGLRNLANLVRVAAEDVAVPIALHLDHGSDYQIAIDCIEAGFTSVMIDGSHHSLDENIRVTKEVADFAHKTGVTVEAELGRLGGIEDDVNVDEHDAFLTDPDEAVRFVKESGCDALAVAVGTSHGAYKFKTEAKLDFERIDTIKKRLGIPLVLHGASGVPKELTDKMVKFGGEIANAKGVPDEAYRTAITNGINKINIDTDLRLCFTGELRRLFAEEPKVFDPRKIVGAGRAAIKEVIKGKMELFGSVGKA